MIRKNIKEHLGTWLSVCASCLWCMNLGAWQIDDNETLSGRVEATHLGSGRQTYDVVVPEGKRAVVRVTRSSFSTGNCQGGMRVIFGSSTQALSSNGSSVSTSCFAGTTSVTVEAYVSSVDTYTKVEEGWYYVGGSKIYYPIYKQVEYSYYSAEGYFDLSVTYEDLSPDLSVTTFSTTPSTEAEKNASKTLNITVKNIGGVSAAAATATVYDGEAELSTFDVPSLSSGATSSRSINISNLSVGNHQLRINVSSVSGESSTGNNSRTLDFLVYDGSIPVKVHYDANGGTGTMSDQNILYGANVPLSRNVFTRSKYMFMGWSQTKDGSVAYTDGQAITLNTHDDFTLYAVWRSSVVHFDPNGGIGTMPDQDADLNDITTLSANLFVRPNCIFQGWAISSTGNAVYSDGQNIDLRSGGIILYAIWKPILAIHFSANGGDGSMEDVYFTNVTIRLPKNSFKKDGYEFVGWNCTPNGPEVNDGFMRLMVDESYVTEDMLGIGNDDKSITLTALWGKKVAVRYENGLVNSLKNDVVFYTGSENSWHEDLTTILESKDEKESWLVAKIIGPGDLRYSGWHQSGNFTASGFVGGTYSTSYAPEQGVWSGRVNGFYKHLIGYNDVARRGYAQIANKDCLIVWHYCNSDETEDWVEVSNVSWQKSVDVEFNGNGGLPSPIPKTYHKGNPYGTLPTATMLHGTFIGWFTAPVGGNEVTVESIVPEGPVTLYAHWQANTYRVTYALNGGVHGSTHPTDATYGTAFSVSAPTRPGYIFMGWTVSGGLNALTAKWGTNSNPTTMITGSSTKCANGATGDVYFKNLTATADGRVTLTANWTASYSVIYNSGSFCTGPQDIIMPTDKGQGQTVQLKGASFTRMGYTQTGWATQDGGSKVYALGGNYSADASVTLYPSWTANTYTIRFMANGGAGTMEDQKATYDSSLTLLANAFKREGMRFGGWATSAQGGVVYKNRASVKNLTAEPNAVVVLYAVWVEGQGVESFAWGDDPIDCSAANTYDGFLWKEDALVGLVQVKTAKQTVKKATDRVTKAVTVTTNITATATVTDANGKKWSYSKGVVTVDGVVSGLKCTTKDCPVAEFGVTLGKNGLEGEWGAYEIHGARNGMGTKDDEMMEWLEDYKGKWSVTIAAARLEGAPYQAGESSTLRLQLNVQAKGVVKIAGNWESGAKVSASAQLVMGDGFAYVPMMIRATKTTPAVMALIRIEGETVELVSGRAVDPSGVSRLMSLVGGGRTVEELGEPVYLPSEVSAGGAAFSARVAVDELAYPAKFAAKGLPAGLKINAATGVISGTPTKPGFYTATVTVTSGANSNVKKTVSVPFTIENYVDPKIRIEDAYGPYYVGVSVNTNIVEAADTKASGLPSGLKWSTKNLTDKNIGAVPAWSVYGVPTKACTNTVYFKKSVKETVDGKQKTVTHQASATFRVEGMKPWAVGTFNGGNTNGMVTLTVSNVGKISGKWMSGGTNWTLSAASFDAYISSEQMYVATVIGKSGKLAMTNEIEVTESGIAGYVTSGKDSACPFWEAWRNGWKEDTLKALAMKLKGQKRQVGEVLLTVGSNGAVTAKGTFVTGFDERRQKYISYSASCSTALIPTMEAGLYRVYLYFPPKSGKFDGFSDVAEIVLDVNQ